MALPDSSRNAAVDLSSLARRSNLERGWLRHASSLASSGIHPDFSGTSSEAEKNKSWAVGLRGPSKTLVNTETKQTTKP